MYMHVISLMATDRQQTRRHITESCFHRQLKQTERIVSALYDRALSPSGLRVTQFTLLVTSSRLGELNIKKLASELAMDQSTLSRNLEPLIKRELIRATVDPEDARAKLVNVTDKGEALIDQAYPLWAKAQGEVRDEFDDQGFEHLLTSLDQFNARNA